MASNFSDPTEIVNDQSNAILRNTISNEREHLSATTTTSSTFLTTTPSYSSSNRAQRQNVGQYSFSEDITGQAETKPFNASVTRDGILSGRGYHKKLLNDAHFIRDRRISFNQFDRKTLELMCEDKVSRHKLEQAHTSSFSSSKHTFIMTFSPDGQQVASTHGDHSIYICDLNTGKLIDTLEGHPKTPWCLAWHPSNKDILASGCLAGEVRVWDLKSRACESWTSENSSIITSLDFHPKERLLVIAASNDVYFWDWSESQPFAKATTTHDKEKVKFVGFDSSGTKLITGIANLPKFGGHYVSDSLQYRIIDDYLTHGAIEQFPASAPTTLPMTENMTQNSEITGSITNRAHAAATIVSQQPQRAHNNNNSYSCLRSSLPADQDHQSVLMPTGPSTSGSLNEDAPLASSAPTKRKQVHRPSAQIQASSSNNSSEAVPSTDNSPSKRRKTETANNNNSSTLDGAGRSETDMIEPARSILLWFGGHQVYRMVRGSSPSNIAVAAAAAAAAAAARQSIEPQAQPARGLPSVVSAPNRDSSQRHPHLHVYQTRGLGQHLWFEQWTIPLPMNYANYRLQCWNFSPTDIPNIKDSQSNVITRKCRIHNASSVDISSDGTLVACLVPRGDNTCVPNFDLKVLSLKSYDFGTCYHQIAHGPNAMSVSFSPTANYAVVGLATNKFVSNDPNDDDLTIGRVFKFNKRNSSSHVRDIKIKRDDTEALSLNAIRWISRGIVYNLGPKHGSRYQATRVRNRVA